MTSIGLFFSGSVLFVNGVDLLGGCDATETAPVKAFVGVLLVAVVAIICTSPTSFDQSAMFSAVGFLVFAFTYLGVAINTWTRGSGVALGWYACGRRWCLSFSPLFNSFAIKTRGSGRCGCYGPFSSHCSSSCWPSA